MPSPRYHREIPQRYRLEAEKCMKCGKILFPPRLICPECGSKIFEKVILPENGKIITFTIIRVAPEEFATQVPYCIAVVELENRVRITTQVVDCKPEDIEIGKSVMLVFRKVQEEGKTGIICYGYKAVLV
ncbi:MAG: Zn-ribbon domain-containing OB-fold protein [Candidatus Cloacimonetes bacterium]|nr:Zn-ribbon domain-containing OB-fold protein [Candidatus Cloacimonadota bacterium]